MSSVFTKIINGEIPCYKIYEDDKTLSFLNINPETRGHVLVIPKIEVEKVYDLPQDYFQALMDSAKKIAQHMDKKLGARIVWKIIGKDVPHAHVHLLPFDETWTKDRVIETTPEEFEQIRQELELTS